MALENAHKLFIHVVGACFNERGIPTVLMEYCAGGNLRKRLIKAMQDQKPLKLAKKYQYAHELALGMYFLHGCSEPVIHRDLKPANILLSKDDHIKISDFGLSKFMPQRRRADIEALKESDRYTMTGETGSYRVSLQAMVKAKIANACISFPYEAVVLRFVIPN